MNEQLVPLFPTLVYSEIIPEEYIQLIPELEKHSNIERIHNLNFARSPARSSLLAIDNLSV